MNTWLKGSVHIWRELTHTTQRKTQSLRKRKIFTLWKICYDERQKINFRNVHLAPRVSTVHSQCILNVKRKIWYLWIKECKFYGIEKKLRKINKLFILRKGIFFWIRKVFAYFPSYFFRKMLLFYAILIIIFCFFILLILFHYHILSYFM